jgi:hypothetical protein
LTLAIDATDSESQLLILVNIGSSATTEDGDAPFSYFYTFRYLLYQNAATKETSSCVAPWQCDHQAFQLGESLTVGKGFKQLIRLKAHF